MTVTSRKVLRCYDADHLPRMTFDEQDLTVVVGEISVGNDLIDEYPKLQRLVRRLVVEYQVELRNAATFRNEVKTPEELLGDREGGLPDFRNTDLPKYPFQDVSNLKVVGKIRLDGRLGKRL